MDYFNGLSAMGLAAVGGVLPCVYIGYTMGNNGGGFGPASTIIFGSLFAACAGTTYVLSAFAGLSPVLSVLGGSVGGYFIATKILVGMAP